MCSSRSTFACSASTTDMEKVLFAPYTNPKRLGNTPFGTVVMLKSKRGKCIRHQQLLMIPHDFGFPLQEEKVQKRLRFSAPANRALTSIFNPQYVK